MKGLTLSAVVFAAGCVPRAEAPNPGGDVVTITQGQVGAFHGLRLGVMNILEGDFADEAGVTRHGPVAVLALRVEGPPPQEKDFRVHTGQRIALGGYSVSLEEIRGTVKGAVTVRIEESAR